MRTTEYRRTASRQGLRYPSDLMDSEWGLIAPMIPSGRRGGGVGARGERSRGAERDFLCPVDPTAKGRRCRRICHRRVRRISTPAWDGTCQCRVNFLQKCRSKSPLPLRTLFTRLREKSGLASDGVVNVISLGAKACAISTLFPWS
jgi:hypothetical protein